jgi:hypothetical protein
MSLPGHGTRPGRGCVVCSHPCVPLGAPPNMKCVPFRDAQCVATPMRPVRDARCIKTKKSNIMKMIFIVAAVIVSINCSRTNTPKEPDPPPTTDTVYDETGCLYTSYKNLVMAGYQGWFAA